MNVLHKNLSRIFLYLIINKEKNNNFELRNWAQVLGGGLTSGTFRNSKQKTMTKLSKDEAWKIYETLPKELKQAIFSEETANSILSACQRNGLIDQRISQVAELVGYSLMGILPLENLTQEIIQATNATQSQASQIFNEINRLVFYPVKIFLDELYSLKPKERPVAKATGEKEKLETMSEPQPETFSPKPLPEKDDTYREPVE